MKHVCLIVGLCALHGLAGGEPEAAIDGAPVLLSGPEVSKLDWGVRAVTAGDVDGDGKTDLALLNNDRARVEVLYQREPGEPGQSTRSLRPVRWEPVMDDARFEREGVASGIAMFDLAVGDVTGNGLADLVFTGKDEPLSVVAQIEPGVWADKRGFDDLEALPWSSTLHLAELDPEHEGLELVVLARNELIVFSFDEDGEPSVLSKSRRPEGNALDLAILPASVALPIRFSYRVPGSPRPVRLVTWDTGHGPSAERAFALDSGSPGMAWIDPEAAQPRAVVIEARTSRVRIEEIAPEERGSAPDWPLEFYATGAEANGADSLACADFTGDGLVDIVVADPANAQLWLLPGKLGGGWRYPRSFPAYQGVASLAATNPQGEGLPELFVLSDKEKSVGLTRWNGERLIFPETVEIAGEPKRLAWLADRQQLAILAAVGDNAGEYAVLFLERDAEGWAEALRVPLDGVRREPKGMLWADIDQDGTDDLLLATARDAARYVRLNELDSEDLAAAVKEIDGLRDLDPQRLGLGDVDGDGYRELLVAGEGFVRAVRLDDQLRRVVVDQFNARSGNDRLSVPALRDFDGDGEPELLLFDDRGNAFQVLSRDDSGVFRYHESVDFGDFSPVAIVESAGLARDDLMVLGMRSLARVPLSGPWAAMNTVSTYESDLEDVVYNDVHVGELNGSGGLEILLVDGQNNVLEILKWEAPDHWSSALHFNVFEEDLHYGGRKGAPLEPREVVIGDFTNDGREDIVLLVHDRLLLYPQGEAPVSGIREAP